LPGDRNFSELISLTLGIFSDSVNESLLTGGRANFQSILELYLFPYFTSRKRCLGIGEYFLYGDAKFKVLAAFPSYGVVTGNTAIFCSQLLSRRAVCKIHILPVNAPLVNPPTFNNVISPFFRRRPQHISTGQYLYLNRTEYMIIASQPIDGVVTQSAQFFFEGETLTLVQQIVLSPYFEELPTQIRSLTNETLHDEIMNMYLMPYFQGAKRLVAQGQEILINGVNFLVEQCFPPKGVTHESTLVIYECSFKSRTSQQELFMVPTHGYYSPHVQELNRQLFHLQLLMQSLEMGGSEPEGASVATVQALPIHKLSTIPSNPEAARCMICLTDYVVGDDVKTLPCFHMFHPECINTWMEKSKLCPLCRASVEIAE
jgi:hypothetical protein